MTCAMKTGMLVFNEFLSFLGSHSGYKKHVKTRTESQLYFSLFCQSGRRFWTLFVPTFAQKLFVARVSEICALHGKNNGFARIVPPGATPAPVQRSIKFHTDFSWLLITGLVQFCSPFGPTFPRPAGAEFLTNSWGLVCTGLGNASDAPKLIKKTLPGKVHPLDYLGIPFGNHVAHIGLQPGA
jgi:hypothetical protein